MRQWRAFLSGSCAGDGSRGRRCKRGRSAHALDSGSPVSEAVGLCLGARLANAREQRWRSGKVRCAVLPHGLQKGNGVGGVARMGAGLRENERCSTIAVVVGDGCFKPSSFARYSAARVRAAAHVDCLDFDRDSSSGKWCGC